MALLDFSQYADTPEPTEPLAAPQPVGKALDFSKYALPRDLADASGLVEPGNVDIFSRPRVKMPDGSVATVRSMSIEEDGKEVLIPSVSDDGRLLSDDEAVREYRRTKRHLGKFDNRFNADVFAEKLHRQQADFYGYKSGGKGDLLAKPMPDEPAPPAKAAPGSFLEHGLLGKFDHLTPEQARERVTQALPEAERELAEFEALQADVSRKNKPKMTPKGMDFSALAEDHTVVDRRIADRLKQARERVQNIKDMLAGKAPLPKVTPLRDAIDRGFAAVASIPGAVAKSAGLGYSLIPGAGIEENNLLVRLGDDMEETVRQAFPGDPAQAEEWVSQFASGTGSMIGFVLSSAAGGGLLRTLGMGEKAAEIAPIMFTGAAVQGEQGYEEAKQAGADAAARYASWALNLPLGMSEALPISRMFDRLDAATGHMVARILVNSVAQSFEEFAQEVGQQLGSDTIAKFLVAYDPEREFGATAMRQGGIGAVLGALMGGAGGVMPRPRAGVAPPPVSGAPPTVGPAAPSEVPEGAVSADVLYPEPEVPSAPAPTPPVTPAPPLAAALPEGQPQPPAPSDAVPAAPPPAVGSPPIAAAPEAAQETPPREAPIARHRRTAAVVTAGLPPPAEGMTRLWRGNRPGEVGSNPQFTNDLPGIALPFREAYGGDLSYVDIPTSMLAQFESKGVAAPGAEFILPPDAAKMARVAPLTPPPAPVAQAPVPLPAAGEDQPAAEATFDNALRGDIRQRWQHYLDLEKVAAGKSPDELPPGTYRDLADAEDALVESVRLAGLPGDSIEGGAEEINSVADIKRAFQKATPEQMERYWLRQKPAGKPLDFSAQAGEPGAPEHPVKVATADDLRAAEVRVEQPRSQEAAEAGEYKKAHIDVQDTDIEIETAKGAMRRGKGRDGKPWEVKMPAAYGKVKGVRQKDGSLKKVIGADGEEPDVSVGDHPQVTKAWVIDQFDAETGKFDETKSWLAVPNGRVAKALYLRSFSDDKGPTRFGGITEMSVAEWHKWLAEGNHSQPLSAAGKARAGIEEIRAKMPDSQTVKAHDELMAEQARRDAEREARRAAEKKPKTPQVAPLPGSAPLGAKKWTDLEPNEAGDMVQVDERGVRSILKGGIRRTEPVMMKPGGGFEVRADRGEWMLASEKPEPVSTQVEGQSQAKKYGLPADTVSTFAEARPGDAHRGKFQGYAWTNDGGRLSVDAFADEGEAARNAALVKLKAELDRRSEQRAKKAAAYSLNAPPPKTDTLPDAAALIRPESDWHAKIVELDAENAPDDKYRTILSAGSKETRADGRPKDADNWRQKIVRLLQRAAERPVQAPEAPAAPTAQPPAPAAQAPAPAPAYGAKNKIVSGDRAAEARARLKAKFDAMKNQANTGLDPEMLADGTTLAVYHIEAGARRFADFARKVIDDLGISLAQARPYLRSWYVGARLMLEDGGASIDGMDTDDEVRASLATIDKEIASGNESSVPQTPPGVPEEPAPADVPETGGVGPVAEPPASGGGRSDEDVRPDLGGDGVEPEPAAGPGAAPTSPGKRSPRRGGGRSKRGGVPAAGLTEGQAEAEQAIAEQAKRNYRITPEDAIGQGGPKEKVRANIAALRLLKEIQGENREATEDEKRVLVKFVGWGAFAQDVFATHKPEWKTEQAALKDILTPDEYAAARTSTLNAHYTSEAVIRGIWKAVERLGFTQGRAIEPSAGVGHFIGLQPATLADATKWSAVELDTTTGAIAKLLYAGSDVNVMGFEAFERPDNFYDLAISNVPFGDYPIRDTRYPESYFVHDYFFIKALDKVRPGGVVAFITSSGTMDKQGGRARTQIARRAEFLGAIRLPGGKKGAFAGNAGTEVTTDIIFLRKRILGQESTLGKKWGDLKEIKTPDGPTLINEFFANNPQMMLGEMRLQGTMYRDNQPVLVGDSSDLDTKIAEAAKNLPENVIPSRSSKATLPPPEEISLAGKVKPGAFTIEKGKIFRKLGGVGVEQKLSADDVQRVTSLMKIRDTFNAILSRDPKVDRDALRKTLNAEYDAFVKKWGPIGRVVSKTTTRLNKAGEPIVTRKMPNFSAFKHDPDAYKVLSIENYDEPSDTATKAAIFREDIVAPPAEPVIAGPRDAIAVSLDKYGRLVPDAIGEMLGMPPAEAMQSLGDFAYLDPNGETWRSAEQYLSGDVVGKLNDARKAVQSDPQFQRNVDALLRVQPTRKTRSDIRANMGAPWVPVDVYISFLKEQVGADNVTLSRNKITHRWAIGPETRFGRDAAAKYATGRIDIKDVAEASINNVQVAVYDTERTPDGTRQVYNAKESALARAKVEQMRLDFRGDIGKGIEGWAFKDDTRATRLEDVYNETFNRFAAMTVSGDHMTFPGLAKSISKADGSVVPFSLMRHQRAAVARIIQMGNTLLAHVVGAGKTFTMIASGMEQKRLGLINRPMYVVPNHMLEQFSREFLQAYPGAAVLVADKGSMSKANRAEFAGRVASEKWDAIVITHDAFGRMGMSDEFTKQFLEEQIAEYEEAIAAARATEGGKGKRGKSQTVKDLERQRNRLAARLKKLIDKEAKDIAVTFEELGVDFLYVDEAHLFKNLGFPTMMKRVKGLATSASQRATSLFMKIRYLEQMRPGRSAVFATGTPISNTIAEMYTMQRYLQLEKLKELGIDSFDAWAATFGEVKTATDLAPDGRTFQEVTAFSRFSNIADLVSIYSQVADTQTASMLKLPTPRLAVQRPSVIEREELRLGDEGTFHEATSGRRGITVVEAEPTAEEEQFIQHLIRRAAGPFGRPTKGADNMLVVITDGRKVATDARLLDAEKWRKAGLKGEPQYNPQGKTALLVNNVKRVWEDSAATKSAQIIFLDMGVPQAQATEGEIAGAMWARVDRETRARWAKEAGLQEGSAAPDLPWGELSREEKRALTKAAPDEQDLNEDLEVAMDEDGNIVTVDRDMSALLASKFDLYGDLKQRLIDSGIPANEIAFIHDAADDDAKARLFAKVRRGDIRVLIGTTGKMGVGTNVQAKLIAMHHYDAPWKPAEVEQRDGRIMRQGNENPEVQIYRYITKRSFDAFMWQTLERKAGFISQIQAGSRGMNEAEDIDEVLPEAAQLKAAAAGDSRIMEREELKRQVRDMDVQRQAYYQAIDRAKYALRDATEQQTAIERNLALYRQDAARIPDKPSFQMTVGGQNYTDRTKAGEAVVNFLAAQEGRVWSDHKRPGQFVIGEMFGMKAKLYAYRNKDGVVFWVGLDGARQWSGISVSLFSAEADHLGMAQRFWNLANSIKPAVTEAERKLAEVERSIPRIKEQADYKPWPQEQVYAETQARLKTLEEALKPQKADPVVQGYVDKLKAALLDEEKFRDLRESLVTDEKITEEQIIAIAKATAGEDNFIIDSVESAEGALISWHNDAIDSERPPEGEEEDEGSALASTAQEAPQARTAPRIRLDPRDRATLERATTNIVRSIFGKRAGDEIMFYSRIPLDEAGPVDFDYVTAFQAAGGKAAVAGTIGGEIQWFGDRSALFRLALEDPTFDPEASAYHEAYHGVEGLLMTDAEIAAVSSEREMASLRRLTQAALGMSERAANALPGYEARAIAFPEYVRRRQAGEPINAILPGAPTISRWFERLRHLLARLRRMLTNKGFTRWEDIFEDVYQGRMAERPRAYRDIAALASTARRDVTATPEFKRWFGKSKVVDAEGRPLVVYHGTRESFDAFDPRLLTLNTSHPSAGWGFFFSADADIAKMFAGEVADPAEWPVKFRPLDNSNIMPVYLSIQNPKVLRTVEFMDMVRPRKNRPVDFAALKKQWIADGHDGVRILGDRAVGERFGGEEYGADAWAAFAPSQIKSVANRGTFDPGEASILRNAIPPEHLDPFAIEGDEARQEAAYRAIEFAPIDRVVRAPFQLFSRLDERGQWTRGTKISAATRRLFREARFDDGGRFRALNHILHAVRAGVVDRYGLEKDYVDRTRQARLEENADLLRVPELMQAFARNDIGIEEARALHAMLTGEEQPTAEWMHISEPIRQAIDAMGQEAVDLGLLPIEAYERWRGIYMHRLYMKYEAEQNPVAKWAAEMFGTRRKKLLGNEFKGRGLWKEISGTKLEFEGPTPPKGTMVGIFDRMTGNRVDQRAYRPVGSQPQGPGEWFSRGQWEIRGVKKNGNVILWRDFTKDERTRMGEIVDARYTVAKTFMIFAHDLATGRLYRDISLNEAWATDEPDGEAVASDAYSLLAPDPDVEWVKVPESLIPKSKTKKWGLLAGKYVRAEIWRDLNEIERVNRATFWQQLLSIFKVNKTARSPTVHMNNVMSNLLLMDMAGVGTSDLVRAINSMRKKDAHYQDAARHGAFGVDMVSVEIRRNIMVPLLDEIQQAASESVEARVSFLNNLANRLFSRRALIGAMLGGQAGASVAGPIGIVPGAFVGAGLGMVAGKQVEKFDAAFLRLYQFEDELFRMAVFLKRRGQGVSAIDAANEAREQFIDYDIHAPWINAARRSFLPFLAYTYRAVPIIAKTIAHRPWKVGKYFLIAQGLQALSYAIFPGDDDKEKKALPDEQQGYTWIGAPRMMRLPWSDGYGNPTFLDIRRWIPGGDVVDVTQGQSVLGIPAPLSVTGPILTAFELFLNRSAFTGDDLVNDITDDFWQRAAKTEDYLWKAIMPSAAWIPGSWYWSKIGRAIRGATTFTGQPYNLRQAVQSSVGIKESPLDLNEAMQIKGMEFDRVERELGAAMRATLRKRDRGMISESEFEAEIERLRGKRQRAAEKWRELQE